MLLLAGGSGVVPLRSILRHRQRTGSSTPAWLVYSARSLPDVIYRDEPGFWETYGYHMYGDPWKEQRYAGD